MANGSHNDLRPFYKAHGESHEVIMASTDQVYLICITCGISVTQDAVDAGLPVVHPKKVVK